MVVRKVFTKILLIVGMICLLFPIVSGVIKSYYQSKAISTYNSSVSSRDNKVLEEELGKAENYNTALYNNESATLGSTDLSILQEYDKILDIGNGIMGSIDIPKISVNLPIYHGTKEEVLSSGAGHVQGTSIPVGGENTHSVLTAHRGLPSSRLFTRLDELVEGDMFFINIQNNTLAYKVSKIKTINPEQVEYLKIEEGKDLVSLVTCTPYGINTHRLVVTGERVPYKKEEYVSIEKKGLSPRELVFTGIPFIFIGIFVFIKIKDSKYIKSRKGHSNET